MATASALFDSSLAPLSRREFVQRGARLAGGAAAGCSLAAGVRAETQPPAFRLNYILGSPMYGTTPLASVLAEAKKIGAQSIDIWPRPHADHREQIDQMGHDRARRLLDDHGVRLGVITRYDLRPHQLTQEMPVLSEFGGKLLVCGAGQPSGGDVKQRVREFVAGLRETVAEAERRGIKIGIENHSGSLLSTPDSLRYFADSLDTDCLGLAMAPYHLPQDPPLIAELIEHFGEKLVFFQAWQHGKGCMKKLPKSDELLQMPGRGPLDFAPILAALRRIGYLGWTEVFMHPVPRGIPILPTTEEVTAEINRARSYLNACIA